MTLEILNALGGVALILFGVRFLRKGLDKLVGPRLPPWVGRLTGGPIRTAATGLIVGLLAPSTSSQGLLAVSLVRDGTLRLRRALVMLMGAYLGASLLLHLVALDIAAHAPIGLLVGVLLFQGFRSPVMRGVGQLVLAVSFVLMGVGLVGRLAPQMAGSQDFRDVVAIFENYALLATVLAALVAAVLQSTTATLAIFVGLALRDGELVTPKLVVEIVTGANVGITALALFTGWRDVETRRFALGVLASRVTVAGVVLVLLGPLVSLVESMPGSIAQRAAIAHSAFNAAALALVLALAPLIEGLVHRWVHVNNLPDAIMPRKIDDRWSDVPSMALAQTKSEIALAVRVTCSMLGDAWSALEGRDAALMKDVRTRDDTVDRIEKHVKDFLTRDLTDDLDDESERRRLMQLRFMGDIETVGDVIEKRIGAMIAKIARRGLWFGDDEWGELRSVFALVRDALELSGAAFSEEAPQLADELLRMKRRVRDEELRLREQHYTRLQQGERRSIETTDMYVELLSELKHIAHLCAGVAHSIAELKPEASTTRDDASPPPVINPAPA